MARHHPLGWARPPGGQVLHWIRPVRHGVPGLTKSHTCALSYSRLRFPRASRTWMAQLSLPGPRGSGMLWSGSMSPSGKAWVAGTAGDGKGLRVRRPSKRDNGDLRHPDRESVAVKVGPGEEVPQVAFPVADGDHPRVRAGGGGLPHPPRAVDPAVAVVLRALPVARVHRERAGRTALRRGWGRRRFPIPHRRSPGGPRWPGGGCGSWSWCPAWRG